MSNEDIRFVEESDLIGKLIVIADLGIRDISTFEQRRALIGLFSYVSYSDRNISVCQYKKDSPFSPDHWVVKTMPDQREVFHAYGLEGKREAQSPVFNFDEFQYELLRFSRGPWLDHIEEIYKKATAPPEEPPYTLDDYYYKPLIP